MCPQTRCYRAKPLPSRYAPNWRNLSRCDMNLSWLKKHVMIVSFVAAFLIVLGVVVWLQQQASGKKAEIDAGLQEKMSQYNQLLLTKPAPSPANIDVVKQDRAQVDHLYQEL